MTLAIGFPLFPNLQQLDFTGPHEVFSQVQAAKVHLVGKTRDPVMSTSGLAFTPTTDYAGCPDLDVLCIPGGAGVNALLLDAETLAFVVRQDKVTRYTTSVCTGALVLGAAGLIRGRRATTHWLAHDLLARFGALPTKGRVVQDGKLITAGGVTAGIDFGLTIIAELFGRDEAEQVQLYLEYAPAPPFSAGTPDEAPAALVASVRQSAAATRAAREALIAEATARAGA